MLPWEMLRVQIFCLFFIWASAFFLLICKSSGYKSDISIIYILTYSKSYLFTFLIVSFDKQKFLLLPQLNLSFFPLYGLRDYGDIFKKSLHAQGHEDILLSFYKALLFYISCLDLYSSGIHFLYDRIQKSRFFFPYRYFCPHTHIHSPPDWSIIFILFFIFFNLI